MTGLLLTLVILLAPVNGDSSIEQRVMKLSQLFRCLVCQNESIADSHADLAVDLRQQIREQILAGRTDAQITTFLTDRYGDFVLYRPRVTPKTYALWFGPFALLAGGLYALRTYQRRWPQAAARRELSEEDHRRAEKLLQARRNPNVAVYRDQFAEIDADLRSGVLTEVQYQRDHEDLKRRLLEDCELWELWGQTTQSPNSKKRN